MSVKDALAILGNRTLLRLANDSRPDAYSIVGTSAGDGVILVNITMSSEEATANANDLLRAAAIVIDVNGHKLQARVPPGTDADCVWKWDDWGPCSVLCGVGRTSRVRLILQPAQGQGRPCPTQLVIHSDCTLPACTTPDTLTHARSSAVLTSVQSSSAAKQTTATVITSAPSSSGDPATRSKDAATAVGVGVVALCIVLVASVGLIVYLRRLGGRNRDGRVVSLSLPAGLDGRDGIELTESGFENPLWGGFELAAPMAAAVINMHKHDATTSSDGCVLAFSWHPGGHKLRANVRIAFSGKVFSTQPLSPAFPIRVYEPLPAFAEESEEDVLRELNDSGASHV